MGFGSYDESEQESGESDADLDESEAVNVHENDHDGKVAVSGDASSEELVEQLQEMKDSDADDSTA